MNTPRDAHAIVHVTLRPTEDGGRRSPIPAIAYRCPVFFGNQRIEANDCVFYFDRLSASLAPGMSLANVQVKFLAPDLVAQKLYPRTRFTLWEGRDIGEAEVQEVMHPKKEAS